MQVSLFSELDNLSLNDLISCFEGPAPDGKEYAATYYTEVAYLIGAKGTMGIAFLRGNLDHPDSNRLVAVLLALTATQPHNHLTSDVLARYLRDTRPPVVAAAIDGMSSQGNSATADQVVPLLHHPDALVKGSVLRYLARLYPETAVATSLKALNDADYIVRENAVDVLDDLGAVKAIPYLQPLLEDPHPDVRQAAHSAICRLSEIDDDA